MSIRRVSQGVRCPNCRMAPQWCYCLQLRPVDFKTRVTFIIHHKERFLPSNTANLLGQISPNCDYFIRGGDSQQELNLLSGYHSLYLYPDENAQELTPDFLSSILKPIQLIVPDGTWRQAKKVKKRMPAIASLTSVKFSHGQLSRYFLRKQKNDFGLSTFEAVAHALKLIESESTFQELSYNFEVMMNAFAKANPYRAANFVANM